MGGGWQRPYLEVLSRDKGEVKITCILSWSWVEKRRNFGPGVGIENGGLGIRCDFVADISV